MTTATAPQSAPRPTTLDEVRALGAVPVWSATEPSAAGVLGISRSHAYGAARAGDIPTIRLGGRVMVPVPALIAMLGGQP